MSQTITGSRVDTMKQKKYTDYAHGLALPV